MATTDAISKARELLTFARKVAKDLRDDVTTSARRVNVCRRLLSETAIEEPLEALRLRLSKLTIDERHYWVGTFYTLLLPTQERQDLAAYFTPPQLTQSILKLAADRGFKAQSHTVIDPAAGGAAFLSTIAAAMRRSRAPSDDILDRLRGMEIDPGLARLSEILISKRIGYPVERGAVVRSCDSLKSRQRDQFDLVVANPPYGRVALADVQDAKWEQVSHSGHINRYALFTELCLRLAKPGGLVALVLPASFMAGPLYDRLRSHIRSRAELLLLGSVIDRDDVFVDVAQDVAVVLARVGKAHSADSYVTFGTFAGSAPFEAEGVARLPKGEGASWCSPIAQSRFAVGGATLKDYGVTVRSGYFVWNREKERMKKVGKKPLTVPLVWAQNIRANKFCIPKAKKHDRMDFVRFAEKSPSIIRSDAIVLQRTTTSSQPRRLVAARISPTIIKKYGGVVSENHTIVVTGPKVEVLNNLLLLLNSKPVDDRYRQQSGTASIAVSLLRTLDLPKPAALAEALKACGETDEAIERAYLLSNSAAAEKRA